MPPTATEQPVGHNRWGRFFSFFEGMLRRPIPTRPVPLRRTPPPGGKRCHTASEGSDGHPLEGCIHLANETPCNLRAALQQIEAGRCSSKRHMPGKAAHATRQQARSSIFEYIELFYNRV